MQNKGAPSPSSGQPGNPKQPYQVDLPSRKRHAVGKAKLHNFSLPDESSAPLQKSEADPRNALSFQPFQLQNEHSTIALSPSPLTPNPNKESNPTSSGEDSTSSPRRIRGPLHLEPFLVRCASFLHLTTRLLLFTYILSIPLALHFHHPLQNTLYLLAAFILSTLFWLQISAKARCRVCGMTFLRSRRCIRSKKAPNLAGLGTHNSFAILALYKGSVRCPYCGTVNRLRPKG